MKIDPKLRGFGAVAIAALMLGTAPAALFAETPADTLVVADAIDDIVSLDPHEAYEFSGLDLNNNTYDGLVELDPATSAMIPGLSDSWTASEDGLTFTFHIKEGITFSSGNPLRAEDAAFSLQRAVKINKTPAFILNQFGWTAENVDTMVTADGENVIIKVDKPYAPTFLYNCLTAGVASIVDKDTVMANEVDGDMGNAWLKNNSAGTGAYTLKSFKPNEGYVLEMRPGHWRGDAAILWPPPHSRRVGRLRWLRPALRRAGAGLESFSECRKSVLRRSLSKSEQKSCSKHSSRISRRPRSSAG